MEVEGVHSNSEIKVIAKRLRGKGGLEFEENGEEPKEQFRNIQVSPKSEICPPLESMKRHQGAPRPSCFKSYYLAGMGGATTGFLLTVQ
jgi:hypothetical protein